MKQLVGKDEIAYWAGVKAFEDYQKRCEANKGVEPLSFICQQYAEKWGVDVGEVAAQAELLASGWHEYRAEQKKRDIKSKEKLP